MSTLADLCAIEPDAAHGVQIADSPTTGVWLLVVEILEPAADAAVWGAAVWNTEEWGDDGDWRDISSSCTGIEWTDGTQSPVDRYRTATGLLTIAAPEGELGPFSSLTAPFFGEGTPLRIGLINLASPGVVGLWIPLFTGSVESITDPIEGDALGQHTQLGVRIIGAAADLAAVTAPAVPAEGAGEALIDRLTRLVTATGWRWPISVATIPAITTPTFEATTLTGNRLAEINLTADSAGCWASTDPTGQMQALPFTAAWRQEATRPIDGYPYLIGERHELIAHDVGHLEVVPIASGRIWRDDSGTVSDTVFARTGEGATAQSFRGGARGGDRVYSRADLICQTDANVAELAELEWLRRDASTLRAHVELDAAQAEDMFVLLASLRPGYQLDLWREFALEPTRTGMVLRLGVHGLTHRVTPVVAGTCKWTASLDALVWDMWPEGTADATQNPNGYPFPYDPA